MKFCLCSSTAWLWTSCRSCLCQKHWHKAWDFWIQALRTEFQNMWQKICVGLAQSWSLCLLHCFHSQNSKHSPIKFSIQNFEINNRKSERSNMFRLSAQRSMSNAGALFLDRSWHGGEQPSQSLVKWKQMSSLRTHAGSSRNELDNAQVSSERQETWNMAGWQKWTMLPNAACRELRWGQPHHTQEGWVGRGQRKVRPKVITTKWSCAKMARGSTSWAAGEMTPHERQDQTCMK